MLMHSAPAYTAYDNMLVPIQTPRSSSLIARLTHKPVPLISLELHNLYGFRAEQIKRVRVKVDRKQGDILIESFPWVTDLTITLVNAPSLTTIATALSQFPNTRNLTIIITPEAPNSKKHRAARPSLSLQKLTAILPHVRVFELSGWNDEICEWICKTSTGISFMDIKEYQHTSATPKQTKLLQTLLDNNKEMVIFTLATFYQGMFSCSPSRYDLCSSRICSPTKLLIAAQNEQTPDMRGGERGYRRPTRCGDYPGDSDVHGDSHETPCHAGVYQARPPVEADRPRCGGAMRVGMVGRANYCQSMLRLHSFDRLSTYCCIDIPKYLNLYHLLRIINAALTCN